jgi:4-hydroxy-tetrahydrodipicolinate synthase
LRSPTFWARDELAEQPMKYRRQDAKAYAQERMRGVWAAAPTPFRAGDLAFDEAGWRRNLRHWFGDLEIDGLFVGGKQGEFFSMSVAERKLAVEMAVEEARSTSGRAQIIASCSDQNLDTVLDLAAHAEAAGADYVVVHAPMLHFAKDVDRTVFEYYRHIGEKTGLGIAMWSHPDSGYLMSPELCAKIAREVPNVVAIKYSVPREMYFRLSRMTEGTLIVSTASEEEWLDNVLELGWRLYLCSIPPLIYQTATDRRIRDYTRLAFAGEAAGARKLRDSLEPVRHALKSTRPHGTPQAQQKYWQELLGQVGGPVRRPLLPLEADEKRKIKAAFDACGLGVPARQAAPA